MGHEHFIRLYYHSVIAFVVIHMQCCEQCVVWTLAAVPDSHSPQLHSPVTSLSVLQFLPAFAASSPLAGQMCRALARAASLLAGVWLVTPHFLLASQVRQFRSHGFWTASCVDSFFRKSVPIRPFLYQICLKLSSELISYWGRDQANEQYVNSALLSYQNRLVGHLNIVLVTFLNFRAW